MTALAERIASRAARCGLALPPGAALALARHAERVLAADERLHLTAIRELDTFLERHVGESLEGAAMIAPGTSGTLLDLGSGNGYPGLPVVLAHPDLVPILAESSARKAGFLRELVAEVAPRGSVIERQVQRSADLDDQPPFDLIVTRAMGNWERVLPRLASRLAARGAVLVWAGEELESVRGRVTWRRYRLVGRRPLPGRERSWVWRLEPC